MQISITGHHYHISDTTREHIQGEADKLERFYSPLTDCHVTVTKEGDDYRTDVVVNLHGQTLKSSDSQGKLYPSIDAAMDKMVRQLKKLHDKRRRPRSTGIPPVPEEDGE